LLLGPRFAIPIIELALLAALIATNPRRMVRQSRWSRIAATALAGLVIVASLTALGMLIARLVASNASGGSLLLGAMQVWITNVIGFGLLFWELDRHGPVARRKVPRKELPPADWRFSQDKSDATVIEVAAGSSKDVRLGPNICRLPLRVLTNSSDRHNAPHESRQGVEGATGHRRAADRLARHRPPSGRSAAAADRGQIDLLYRANAKHQPEWVRPLHLLPILSRPTQNRDRGTQGPRPSSSPPHGSSGSDFITDRSDCAKHGGAGWPEH
jgi:hypothetical protein